MVYHNVSLLFSGDAQIDVGNKLFDAKIDLSSMVLKVPHHGSKNGFSADSKILSSIKPEISIISVGEKNKYNHPSPEVLDTFSQYNIKIFRTDLLGAIDVKTNGKNYSVQTDKK